MAGLLLALSAFAPAAAAPARLRVTVTREGVAETRVVERTVPRSRETAASSGEKVSLSRNGWRLQGVVAGSRGAADTSKVVPRGVTLVSFFAKLGLALGFINDLASPVDVEVEVCVDPIIAGLDSVYGGSIASSLLDGEGDGTGSVTTDSMGHPFYELRVDTALCDALIQGTVTTVDTLYDSPQVFNVPGVYQGLTIGEQFFGSPIPSQGGPASTTAFEMVIRFRLTRGEFVGFTSVGVVEGEGVLPGISTSSASGSETPVPRAAELTPRGFPTPGLIAPQSFGAPIPSAAGPAVNTSLRLDLDFEFVNDCMATFLALYVVPACESPSYDVDGNGLAEPLTDGLLILRFLFGFTGSALTNNALGQGATRTNPADIVAYLTCVATAMLDVDANGQFGALTDGLLILRYLFGFTGTTLTSGAIGQNAQRSLAIDLAAFMDQFTP